MNAPEEQLREAHEAREQGRLGDASALYGLIVDGGDPEASPMARLCLGVICERQGDSQAARAEYGHAIGTGHPEAALLARFNLAKINEGEGDIDWAIHYFKEVVNMPEQHPWATPWAAYNIAILLWKHQSAWLVGKAYMEQAASLAELHGNAEVTAEARKALDALPG